MAASQQHKVDNQPRLKWFGHVEWKEENIWVKKCTRMNETGVVGRGDPSWKRVNQTVMYLKVATIWEK